MLTSRSIDHDKGGRQRCFNPALKGERVTLAPSLLEHLPDVLWVQAHVHRLLRVVDMEYFTLAPSVDWVARKQAEAVLLDARRGRAQAVGILPGQALDGGAQDGVALF